MAVVRVVIYDKDGNRVADSGDMVADEKEAHIALERPLKFPPGSTLMWWSNGIPKDEKPLPQDMVALVSMTFGPYRGPDPSTGFVFADEEDT